MTVMGIHGLMVFDPRRGTINLLANTPGAETGEFQVAHAALEFTYDFTVTHKNRFMQFQDFSAEIIGQIAGAGADINIYLTSPPSTGTLFWQVFETLRFTDKKTREDERIDLLNFVNIGETVRLTVDLSLLTYSATVQIQEDPALGALPAESAVSFRLTIPKQ